MVQSLTIWHSLKYSKIPRILWNPMHIMVFKRAQQWAPFWVMKSSHKLICAYFQAKLFWFPPKFFGSPPPQTKKEGSALCVITMSGTVTALRHSNNIWQLTTWYTQSEYSICFNIAFILLATWRRVNFCLVISKFTRLMGYFKHLSVGRIMWTCLVRSPPTKMWLQHQCLMGAFILSLPCFTPAICRQNNLEGPCTYLYKQEISCFLLQ
jgi:hypothetical protein